MIIAIDPGPEHSAFVTYDGQRIHEFVKIQNEAICAFLHDEDNVKKIVDDYFKDTAQ
jgi:hypothetical protein